MIEETADNPYRRTLAEVFKVVSERSEPVTYGDLVSWARQKHIGPLTLQMVLDELTSSCQLEAVGLEAAEGDATESKCFVVAGRSISKPERKAERERQDVDELSAATQPEQVQCESTQPAADAAEASAEHDRDVIEAIQYLNDYRSVGVLRFHSDLQRLGVADSQKVLSRLVKQGYVEISGLGVVNASEKLPPIRRRVTLGEVFSALSGRKQENHKVHLLVL